MTLGALARRFARLTNAAPMDDPTTLDLWVFLRFGVLGEGRGFYPVALDWIDERERASGPTEWGRVFREAIVDPAQ